MIAALVAVVVTVTVISLILIEQSNQEKVYAQTQTQVTNFTQLFSADKEFQLCPENIPGLNTCIPIVDVHYQDPTLLVLSSDYIDVIWKAVARAQKEGYQIDAMTSYAIGRPSSAGGGSDVNLLVAMSK